jgi:hypothetical protein
MGWQVLGREKGPGDWVCCLAAGCSDSGPCCMRCCRARSAVRMGNVTEMSGRMAVVLRVRCFGLCHGCCSALALA